MHLNIPSGQCVYLFLPVTTLLPMTPTNTLQTFLPTQDCQNIHTVWGLKSKIETISFSKFDNIQTLPTQDCHNMHSTWQQADTTNKWLSNHLHDLKVPLTLKLDCYNHPDKFTIQKYPKTSFHKFSSRQPF